MEQKKNETKTGKDNSSTCGCRCGDTRAFFFSALLIILVAIFSVVYFDALGVEEGKPAACGTPSSTNKITISTDKPNYVEGERISLHIENLGSASVYSEPCKNIRVFEKDEAGQWNLQQADDIVMSYQEGDFEKKEGNADCQIDAPTGGAGTYRVVVPIYYGCEKPSRYGCDGSEIFRSNEFELVTVAGDQTITPAEVSSVE